MKGLTAIELAILLAIILVIAVAVGWYMYTTFIAATSGTPRLNVIGATYNVSGTLTLTVQNPGPVATAYIASVYLQGQPCGGMSATLDTSSVTSPIPVPQGAGVVQVTASCSGGLAPAGSSISGQVVLTSGTTYPFTAQVIS